MERADSNPRAPMRDDMTRTPPETAVVADRPLAWALAPDVAVYDQAGGLEDVSAQSSAQAEVPGRVGRTTEVSRQSVIRTYSRYAPAYDLLFGGVQGSGRRKLAQVVKALMPSRILEVGVGTGLTLADYPAQARVSGIDLCPRMLEKARQRASALPGREIDLAVMDAERMTFADDSFDCVTVPYVLSVTPDPGRLVAEIRRVCRPGGHVVVVNHFSGAGFWRPLEHLVGSMADRIGFRSEFDYATHIGQYDWTVVSASKAGLLGLYQVIVIRNA